MNRTIRLETDLVLQSLGGRSYSCNIWRNHLYDHREHVHLPCPWQFLSAVDHKRILCRHYNSSNGKTTRARISEDVNNEEGGEDEDDNSKRRQFDQKWLEQYHNLIQFKNEYGHCNVPQNHPTALGKWVHIQRQNYANDKLRSDRLELLTEVDFSFDPLEEKWNCHYKELHEYKKRYGHVNIERENKNYAHLGAWLKHQRLANAAGRLSEDKQIKLNELDVIWEYPDEERRERLWNERFEKLVEYQKVHGHCNVPQKSGGALGTWVNTQRNNYRRGTLSEARRDELESIGFVWKLRQAPKPDNSRWDDVWYEKYEQLCDYNKDEGHCNVVVGTSQLGKWVHNQRTLHRRGLLPDKRKQLLDEIGFIWEIGKYREQQEWQSRYEELLDFIDKYGSLGEIRPKTSRTLYYWVRKQRIRQKAGKLNSTQKQMLDNLGIEW